MADIFASAAHRVVESYHAKLSRDRNHLAAFAFHRPYLKIVGSVISGQKMRKTYAKAAVLDARSQRVTSYLATLAILALALAWLALPQFVHAQGIVRGAEQGSAEGNRVAGPVGGAVGGAVGAGVGGAVGAVEGIFGVPRRSWRNCGGYRDGDGRFHCYR